MLKLLIYSFIITFSLNSYSSEIFFTAEENYTLKPRSQNLTAPYLEKNYKQLNFNFSPSTLREKDFLEFEVVDGFNIEVRKISLNKSVTGDFIWLGRVEGDPSSYVSFVVNEEQIVGEIYAGGKTYRLGYDNNRTAFMHELGLNKNNPFYKENDAIPVPKATKTKGIISTTSSDQFVDVILATATEAAANPNANATIEAMLAATNLMLADSCVNFRYRLLSVETTPYTSGAKDHTAVLGDLTGQDTGFVPHADLVALHNTRNTLGADLVQIFVDTSSIGVCGLAWRGDFGFMRDEYGFSLVLFGCPAFTMAHEFGHNISLFHDRYQHNEDLTDTSAVGGEHYGFVDTVNGFESIMSYRNHCDENGINCDRIGKFSNPRISHNGVPFGLDGFADNTDALNRAFPFVANYRESVTDFDPGISANCSAAADDKDLHCFIATATYGSYLHPKIRLLRLFRDLFLKPNLIGKNFVKFYYKVSPKMVPYLKKYPQLKSISRSYLNILIFVLTYSWALVFFLLFFLFRKTKKIAILGLLLLVSPDLEAQYSMTPFFRNTAPGNPSLLLDSQSYLAISPSFNILTSSADPNAITSTKESGNSFDVFTGYGSNSFAIALNYTPQWEKKTETTTTPFAKFETTEDISNLEVSMAFDIFDYLPIIGLNYSSQTSLTKDNTQQELIDKKLDSLNIGSMVSLGMVQMGGGIIYNQESGEDKANSQTLPDAKWISAYLAFAFDFNFSGLSSGSFGSTDSSGSGFGKDGFQLEVFYLRDPEVVEISGTNTVAKPQSNSYGAFGQYATPFGISKFLFSFEFLIKDQSSIELLSPDSINTLRITTTGGYQIGSWLFSLSTYNQTQDSGFQKSETGFSLGIGLSL